ncbi:MAG: DUF4331 domain-containing protein [Gemmatimonadetes bacterium]|nr:DUF4331 domain-containing protein [Gemmatimonadota bacterium]
MKSSGRRWGGARRIGLAAVVGVTGAAGLAHWAGAADHRDSVALTADTKADIADVYSFRSPANPNHVVLVMTVDGLIPPSETGMHFFDPDVLYQWKIDNNGDAREDLVIQARAVGSGPGQQMRFRGPAAPSLRGAESVLLSGRDVGRVTVSRSFEPIISTDAGISVFAGLRDDPFFFDLAQFRAILAGQASGFRNPGIDSFAGTNILAIVIELPAVLLGGPDLNVWGTTSRPAGN